MRSRGIHLGLGAPFKSLHVQNWARRDLNPHPFRDPAHFCYQENGRKRIWPLRSLRSLRWPPAAPNEGRSSYSSDRRCCSSRLPSNPLPCEQRWAEEDLNLQGLPQRLLRPSRLPVPPLAPELVPNKMRWAAKGSNLHLQLKRLQLYH